MLALILVTIAVQMAAPDSDWVRLVVVVLEALTLFAILRISRVSMRGKRWTEVIVGVLVVAAIVSFARSGAETSNAPALILAICLSAVAPVLIAAGLVRTIREERAITLHSMFAVLCVYLLLGLLFATGYRLIHELASQPFFAQSARADSTDFLYFSFSTLTTTGFGDLTASGDLGRALTVTEELLGQIYLVTVVALIVANLGARRDS